MPLMRNVLLLQVIGVQPAASDAMRQSVAAGRIVDAPSSDTLSDATAGGQTGYAVTGVQGHCKHCGCHRCQCAPRAVASVACVRGASWPIPTLHAAVTSWVARASL